MSLKLKSIKKEDTILLKNLYQLYLYDLSIYTSKDINSLGLFEDDCIDLFVSEKDLKSFFISYENKIIGFILVQSGEYLPMDDIDYYISEFFILANYRNKGLGFNSLKILFKNFPGIYLSGQLSNNLPAINFWNIVYKKLNLFTENYIEILDKNISLNFILQKFKV